MARRKWYDILLNSLSSIKNEAAQPFHNRDKNTMQAGLENVRFRTQVKRMRFQGGRIPYPSGTQPTPFFIIYIDENRISKILRQCSVKIEMWSAFAYFHAYANVFIIF
jgi:hypothetical protein